MAGRVVFAALAALLAAGCGGNDARVGCSGTGVIITATILVDAGTGMDADAGAGARPVCAGNCREYLEALRVGIETATPATCMLLTNEAAALACVPSATSWCARDTADAGIALEAQIRDYLAASWPEIDDAAVSLDTCLCNAD